MNNMHSKDIVRIYTSAIKWIIKETQAKPKLLCIHSNNEKGAATEDTKYYFQSIQRTCERFAISVQQEYLQNISQATTSSSCPSSTQRDSSPRPKETALQLSHKQETNFLQFFKQQGIHGAIIGQPIPPAAMHLLRSPAYPDVEGIQGLTNNLPGTWHTGKKSSFAERLTLKPTQEEQEQNQRSLQALLSQKQWSHLYTKYTEHIAQYKDEEEHMFQFRKAILHELMHNTVGGTLFEELIPPTVLSVMELLRFYGVHPEGKNVCILGRSKIVGAPLARVMTKWDATVTICHSKTKDIAEHIKRADIVLSAIGQPRFVQGAWIKEGAVVVDVGTSVVDSNLVGDVDEQASTRAKLVTPVPGGVGALTNLMLIKNLLYRYFAFENQK